MKRYFEHVVAWLDRRWPGWPAVGVAAITLLAFALRLHELGRWDLTFDEAASIWIARKAPPDMIRYLLGAFHEHPPFYYLSLWAWTQLAGLGEYALRFWSALAGLLSVPLLYVWLRRLLDRRTGLVAALLLALSPFHIYYSQDARMYALIGSLALLSLICFDRILNDGRRRWWATWGVVTLIGLSTHYFMGLVNVVETIYLVIVWRQHRQALKAWLSLHVGVAALLAVWILASPGLQTTLRNMLTTVGRTEALIRTLRNLSFDIIFGPVSRVPHPWLWAALALGGVGLIVAERHGRQTGARPGWLIGALVLAPPFLVLLTPEALASRYVIFLVFGYVGAVAAALSRVMRHLPVIGVALTLIVVWAGTSRYVHQYNTVKSDYGQVMDTVRANRQPGDALILNGPWQWVLIDYYSPGDVPKFYLPPHTPPALDPEQARPILESIARDFRRIWVNPAAVNIADPDGFVIDWLSANTFPADTDDDLKLYYARREGPGRTSSMNVSFGGVLELRGAIVPDAATASGAALLVDLDWHALRAPGADLVASLALSALDGSVWAERVYRPGEALAAPETWREGRELVDRQALPIPIGTPPGVYALRLNLRRADTGSALMPAGANDDPWITLTNVEVSAPEVVNDSSIPGVPQNAVFGGALKLSSAALNGDRFSEGGWISFDLYWMAEAPLNDGATVEAALVGSDGIPVAHTVQAIAPSSYPVSQWPVGQLVRSRHALQIPPRTSAGDYQIRIGVTGGDGLKWESTGRVRREGFLGLWSDESIASGADWSIGTLAVEAIERRFELPAMQHPVAAQFGGRFKLLGYDMQDDPVIPGGSLGLTVYWQALRPVDHDFVSFTHIVGSDGGLAGQSDHWPRNWTYPTSYWVSGEIVADEVAIAIEPSADPGTYQLLIGWYDSATYDRLTAIDAGGRPQLNDQFLLGTVEIVRP